MVRVDPITGILSPNVAVPIPKPGPLVPYAASRFEVPTTIVNAVAPVPTINLFTTSAIVGAPEVPNAQT